MKEVNWNDILILRRASRAWRKSKYATKCESKIRTMGRETQTFFVTARIPSLTMPAWRKSLTEPNPRHEEAEYQILAFGMYGSM